LDNVKNQERLAAVVELDRGGGTEGGAGSTDHKRLEIGSPPLGQSIAYLPVLVLVDIRNHSRAFISLILGGRQDTSRPDEGARREGSKTNIFVVLYRAALTSA
jgi:hypothetical protein